MAFTLFSEKKIYKIILLIYGITLISLSFTRYIENLNSLLIVAPYFIINIIYFIKYIRLFFKKYILKK